MQPALEVLLIEDDEIDRLLVQELVALRGRGRVRVTEAHDLTSGLDVLDRRPFDLVLLDTRLRDVSALSALRAVGEHAPHTPILPHPTFVTLDMHQAARQRGAWDVVVRGWMDPMWSAMSNLLSMKPEDRAAGNTH
ncbi:MAG TPA: response regulator [Gemmatimonadales bacterium]|nr:response regulator [Gemmatimonadales bacterium]